MLFLVSGKVFSKESGEPTYEQVVRLVDAESPFLAESKFADHFLNYDRDSELIGWAEDVTVSGVIS